MKRISVTALLLLVLVAPAALDAAQARESAPRTVWTCPVHREVSEDAAGSCELCARELEPILVREVWSCPVHPVVSEAEPGSCPICSRPLYPISEEIRFRCPMHAEVEETAPGVCPVCNMALEPSTSARPHQDHNPKHGGSFFMAPDAWHHLEGVYPEPGVFRVYLFDNFSRPLDARAFRGRAVLEESFDPATHEIQELEAYPLRASTDGAYLEAEVGGGEWPREITAKLELERGRAPDRFDFVFADFTRVPDPSAPAARAVAASGALQLPETPEAMSSEIANRNARLRTLVAAGSFDELYVPALEAKDLAIALEAQAPPVAARDQALLGWALKQLVRSAWLLDDYGDLGNKQKVEQAYALFDEAAGTIASLFGATP